MKTCNTKLLDYITNILIKYYRIYGLTFGGLVVEYTANEWTIKCSKFWKYYGYIVIIIILSIEVFILYMVKLQFSHLHVPLIFFHFLEQSIAERKS